MVTIPQIPQCRIYQVKAVQKVEINNIYRITYEQLIICFKENLMSETFWSKTFKHISA